MTEIVTPAEAAIKARLETLGKQVEGWTLVTSGIGDRAVYDGDRTQRAAVTVALLLASIFSSFLLWSLQAMAYSNPTGSTGMVWRRRRHRSEQYRTSSHTSFHFLRQ